ncbi:MAG: hypothetical protein Q9215_007202 [Flavoplaca cf. flavocitrina]
MVATTGAQLLPNAAVTNVRTRLLPLTTILTPNISEARLLLENAGANITPEIKNVKDLVQLASLLQPMGPKYVLVKGGHMPFDKDLNVPQQATEQKYVVDVLHTDDGTTLFITEFSYSKNTHGTGCSLACTSATTPNRIVLAPSFLHDNGSCTQTDTTVAAIASNLALGSSVPDAVENACRYIEAGIKTSADLGHGSGPINHFHSVGMVRDPSCESSLRIREWKADDGLGCGP